jgi:arginyl-tRNA synthetase
MFEAEQKTIEELIRSYCRAHGLPEPVFTWNWIPFSGHWGIAMPFFQLAAQEARQKGEKVNVNQRAQEIAEGIASEIGVRLGLSGLKPCEDISTCTSPHLNTLGG